MNVASAGRGGCSVGGDVVNQNILLNDEVTKYDWHSLTLSSSRRRLRHPSTATVVRGGLYGIVALGRGFRGRTFVPIVPDRAEKCRSWHILRVEPLRFVFIKIVGTSSTECEVSSARTPNRKEGAVVESSIAESDSSHTFCRNQYRASAHESPLPQLTAATLFLPEVSVRASRVFRDDSTKQSSLTKLIDVWTWIIEHRNHNKSGTVTIELAKPFVINQLQLHLAHEEYCYYAGVSMDAGNWVHVDDCLNFRCWARQKICFEVRIVRYISVVGWNFRGEDASSAGAWYTKCSKP